MTVLDFDEKQFNKELIKKIFIPNAIKLTVFFMGLRYLVFLEILKASTVLDIKFSSIAIAGVYVGVHTYRLYLEKVLPILNVTLEDVDNLSDQLFPKKDKLWKRTFKKY